MSARAALLAILLLGGCSQPTGTGTSTTTAAPACEQAPPREVTLFFATGRALANASAADGSAPGNGFREAFLTNDMRTWLSAPLAEGLRIVGNVSLEFWVRVDGQPAAPGSQPGESFMFFDQVGSDRAFAMGSASESQTPVAPGTTLHFNETLPMPAGGFVVEKGSRVRALITSSFTDAGDQPGTTILFGGQHPSRVRFWAVCFPETEWMLVQQLHDRVVLFGNQGGPAHTPPIEGVNRYTYTFRLLNETERLRIVLQSQDAQRVPKQDVDMRLLDANGDVAYDSSSPFTNETLILWPANIAAFAGPAGYTVQVDAYSGTNYSGELYVVMETALDEGHQE